MGPDAVLSSMTTAGSVDGAPASGSLLASTIISFSSQRSAFAAGPSALADPRMVELDQAKPGTC
jgi:hypothetical protein